MSVPSARDERAPHRGTISVSFDNFGEAADLELGRHPQDEPIGRHFTACESFDALLGIVGDRPITYFVEASNALLYPDALRAMRDHGIEIGLHGWRHEHWGRLEPSRRPEVLARGVDALQGIGIRPRGFRPPGGEMREGALAEIARAGLDYCSPLGDAGAAGVSDGVPVLPFAWRHVDAYQLDPRLDALRARHGDPPQAADGAAYGAILSNRQTWGIVGAKALSDMTWWFINFWLADYYRKDFGLSTELMIIVTESIDPETDGTLRAAYGI